MICCLPFTYYSRTCVHVLERLGLPLVFVYPTRRLICEPMQPGLTKGVAAIRTPAAIDETQLDQVLAEYRAWADLHQNNLDALAGFFSAGPEQPPFVDETDPSQIRTQLRRFGQAGLDPDFQRLMRAAVFMAMAHDFDRDQDRVAHDLAAIHKREQQMFNGLSGETGELATFLSADGASREEEKKDPGLYLTDKRIRAWAALAGVAAPEALLYLTTSKAVYDSLCDMVPHAVHLVEWTLDPLCPGGEASLLSEQQLAHLQELSHANGFADVATMTAGHSPQKNTMARLVIRAVPDCPPGAALNLLAGGISGSCDGPVAGKYKNTLIGYLEASSPACLTIR